jgi:hypothetical protein
MLPELTTLSPRQTFEDNQRPAQLLLRVFRLLHCEEIATDGDMVEKLRILTHASTDEELMLIYNEVFLGLVRERAQIPRSTLKHATLNHLLRQAVVASCTALETFLPALLRTYLPTIIRARGRDFLPRGDQGLLDYFSDLTFSLDDTLRLIDDDNAPVYISNRILGLTKFKYLSSKKGVHATGALLGLSNPWQDIATHLNRDRKELMKALEDTVSRRNDIVHRADRPQTDPGGPAQDIGFAWTQHAVDAIQHVCLALDELVAARIAELNALAD